MMYLVVLVLMLLVWAVRGIEQAILWSRTGSKAFSWNEHILFLISRGLYVAVIICSTFMNWFEGAAVAGASIMMFAFIHDGVYYVARNKIATNLGLAIPYIKGFTSQSVTSTATINFSWKTRYMLAIGGLILVVFMIFGL